MTVFEQREFKKREKAMKKFFMHYHKPEPTIKVSEIKKWLEECRKDHSSIENGNPSVKEHYYDSGACSVINYISMKLSEVEHEQS